ncbi:NAD(P)/FAD-dependent oxidoreductase [Acidovorax sp. SUPP3334]|uniref:NAD(P)/FAD-dependent oxidoreductase n=1 Tax=Acidovorax sp. SUPP3334 TaxID=2920881 RepID=UPI0023DE2184|nr:NAD(P)/FAD-dependent oxidoreductase [Acidovorax sp. SUPP3334]GKT20758.1 NAD(P)/FAD-dependent oxidoreductase [Acidovorax sp. SUPP3334]
MRFDALVIGGSVAGLSAAMQIARARRSVCMVDACAPRNRFAAASHGFFGQDCTRPQDMVALARSQLMAYPSVTFKAASALHARAIGKAALSRRASGAGTDAAGTEEGFAVELDSGETLLAQKLLLATGLRDELPAIPGLSERWGATVLHCPYCHGYEVGGAPAGTLYAAPTSVHHAMLVGDWGPMTLFLNGHEAPEPQALAQRAARGIAVEPARVLGLEGDAPALSGVRLDDGRCVPIKALFVPPRTHMASPLAEQLGCAFDEGMSGPMIRVDATQQTTVPGVFAAGDAAMPGHNAALAAANGVMAGVCLHKALVFGT